MILRIDKIEIQQQPERRRFWAEIEAMTPSGFRRNVVTTPESDGYWGLLQAIGDYLDEFLPKPQPVDDASDVQRLVRLPDGADTVVLDEQSIVDDADGSWHRMMDALRADAEAAGVRVDGRWGEARLREEIATVQRGEAAGE